MAFLGTLITMIAMLAVTAVFAAYEMALASVSRTKLVALAHVKTKGAVEALGMKDRMEASLAVVQLGMTLSGAIAAAAGGAGMDEYLAPVLEHSWGVSAWVAHLLSLVFLIIPLSTFTIIFAELIPKTFAIKNPARVCLALSPFMKSLVNIASPAIMLLEHIVKVTMRFLDRQQVGKDKVDESSGLHELNAAVALARTSRLLGAHQEKIVLSAAQLSTRPVKEIMIPIKDVSMIGLNATLTEALLQAHNDMHTRFPVCVLGTNPVVIEGYVNFKDIIAGLKLNPTDPSIKGIVRPIKTVAGTLSISNTLEQMMGEKLHIAMVAGNEGPIGIVTLEDIIEELVGEIEDEFDRMPSYIHPYGGGWLMGGGVTMAALAQAVAKPGLFTPEEEKLKLADWFVHKVSVPLKGGEMLILEGVHIMVRKLRRKKLGEAVVTVVN